ncbi:MAG: hypothetical protein ACKO23_09430 [Gemmataceae bacterium]
MGPLLAILANLRDMVGPLLDWLPESIRRRLPGEAWALIALAILLALLLLVGRMIRSLLRGIGSIVSRPENTWKHEEIQDLDQLPLPAHPAWLTVYHIPANLRLVVAAPLGSASPSTDIARLVAQVIPGMEKILERDQPRQLIWPAYPSTEGFANTFFRRLVSRHFPQPPSPWALLCGRVNTPQGAFFLGMALRTEEPTPIGKRRLGPYDWLNVLHIPRTGSPP